MQLSPSEDLLEIENTKGWIRCLIIKFLFQPFIFCKDLFYGYS